jgi:medium-chain acyl-[acyl-carrier-protein] hydrolase
MIARLQSAIGNRQSAVGVEAASWAIYPRPNPRARLRLFCFPHAGSGAATYRTWPDDLPADVEVCAIQLPGRENRLREPLYTRLSPLVLTLAQVLYPLFDMPFAFWGHSMGALISFELARQLRRQRAASPAYLFVSGHRAPQLPNRYRPIHHLPECEFLAELRKLNGTPQAVLQDADLMRIFLPVLRADLAISETYVYSAEDPLDLPICAFGGLWDDRVGRDEIAAWRDQTAGPFAMYLFPGGHFFLQDPRTQLLQVLSHELGKT